MADITSVPFTDVAAMTGDVWPAIEEEYLACPLGGRYTGGSAVASFDRLSGGGGLEETLP